MTAVEWLEDCLTEQYPNGKFVWNTQADIEALFKRAKEMEQTNTDNKVIHFAEWLTNQHTLTLMHLYKKFEEEYYKKEYER